MLKWKGLTQNLKFFKTFAIPNFTAEASITHVYLKIKNCMILFEMTGTKLNGYN